MPQKTVPGTDCNHWENIKLNCASCQLCRIIRVVSPQKLSALTFPQVFAWHWYEMKHKDPSRNKKRCGVRIERRTKCEITDGGQHRSDSYHHKFFWIRLNWQTHRVIAFGSAAFCLSSCLSVNTNHFISCSSSFAPPLITSTSSRLVCLPQPFSAGMHFLLQWLFTFSEHLLPQCSLRFILCHPHVCVNLLSPCLFPKRTHHWQCAASMQREYSWRKLIECHPVEWLIIIWLRIWSTDTSSNVLLSLWGVIFFFKYTLSLQESVKLWWVGYQNDFGLWSFIAVITVV